MTLTKAQIAERLYYKYDLSRTGAKAFVDQFFDTIKDEIVESGEVKLSGFGNFTTRDKVSRPGRNPKTLEDIEITARRVCTFKPGQKLKSRCEDGMKTSKD